MPTTHSYPTVDPTGQGNGIGKRNESTLQAAFPGSPIYTVYRTTADVLSREDTSGVIAAGPVTGEATQVNDGGYMFSVFDLNFVTAPDILTVETGGEGKPADPYYPNITSPGEGSTSAATQGPYVGPAIRAKVQYGYGQGGMANPIDTSQAIADSSGYGLYISGRSYAGSDGLA